MHTDINAFNKLCIELLFHCSFIVLAGDAFVRTNVALLPWCSSVCLSVWDGRALRVMSV